MFSNKILVFIFLFLVLGIALILTFYLLGYKVKPDNEDGLLIKTKGNILSVKQDLDFPIVDAFGRQRISLPNIIFESKQSIKEDILKWDESYSNVTFSHNLNRASKIVTTIANTTGSYIKQTFRHFDYRPGKSQLIFLTAIILKSVPENAPGLEIKYGQFNERNGLFFEYSNNQMNCIVRSYIDGSVTNKKIPQKDWNEDRMDGTGPSGIIVDWSKIQIFTIDYGWLGADRVRFCLVINGIIYPVHSNYSANFDANVFISTPNNPIRFEVVTTNETPEIVTEQICASVSSEGGDQTDIGIIESISNSGTLNFGATPNTSNYYVLMALRLKDRTALSDFVSSTIQFKNFQFFADSSNGDIEWHIYFDPGYTNGTTTGQNILTWAKVNDYSSLEYSEQTGNIALNTIRISGGTFITGGYITGGAKGNIGVTTTSIFTENQQILGEYIDGTKQTIAVCVRNMSGEARNIRTLATWKEY